MPCRAVQSRVQEIYKGKTKKGFKNYSPKVGTSYATSQRPQDANGTGPGAVINGHATLALQNLEVEVMSGLHCPGGRSQYGRPPIPH